jgi:ribonuclease HII
MPDFTPENTIQHNIVIGIDEAGRGPLAGPVVAACAYIPHDIRHHPVWRDVNDSKKMTAIKRDIVFEIITKLIPYGVGIVDARDIDRINILQATFEAMRRSVCDMNEKFSITPDHAILDGNRTPKEFPCACSYLIKGDSLSTSIAAASIIAKVTRDRIMTQLHETYPYYGWAGNAGYGTPDHLKALETHGFCAEHRQSFAPIKFMVAKAS